MANQVTSKQKLNAAVIFILVGIILIIGATVWENTHDKHSFLVKLLIGLISHFGIGSIVLGALGILIDTSHWIEYFKARLAEIVIDKKYMENLSPESLISLQTEVLKVYFNDDGIGGKDGFLQYYQNHIQNIVGSPFRINVESDMRIEFVEGSEEKIYVYEVLSWNCKANGGKIQSNITWEPSDNEFEKVRELTLILEHELLDVDGMKGKATYDLKKLREWQAEGSDGFNYPLKSIIDLDGLKVTIKSEVVISKNKFIAFRMAHPSRGLSMSIRYPKELTIVKELFGIEDECCEIDDNGKGYYKLSSQKWILPDEGIVFQLVPLNVKSSMDARKPIDTPRVSSINEGIEMV